MGFCACAVFFIGIFVNQIVMLISNPGISEISHIAICVDSCMAMTKAISCRIQAAEININFTASISFWNDFGVLSKNSSEVLDIRLNESHIDLVYGLLFSCRPFRLHFVELALKCGLFLLEKRLLLCFQSVQFWISWHT